MVFNNFGLEEAGPSLKKMTTSKLIASDSIQKKIIVAILDMTHLYNMEKTPADGYANPTGYKRPKSWLRKSVC